MVTPKKLDVRLKKFQKNFEKGFRLRSAQKMMSFYHENIVIVGEHGVQTGRRQVYKNFQSLFKTVFTYKIIVTSNKEIDGGNRWIQQGFIEFNIVNDGKVKIKFEQQCCRMSDDRFLIDALTIFETKRF